MDFVFCCKGDRNSREVSGRGSAAERVACCDVGVHNKPFTNFLSDSAATIFNFPVLIFAILVIGD